MKYLKLRIQLGLKRCPAQDLLGSQTPVNTGKLGL